VGGRCGRRLMAADGGKAHHLRYTCMRATMDAGAPGCLSLAGAFLARCVAAPVLQGLPPASLAVRRAAAQSRRAAREQCEAHGHQRLERAHTNAQRAARPAAAVAPEHRLVARALERPWAEALRPEQQRQAA
jgi:hypothetical protein